MPFLLAVLLGAGAPARAAEFFYLDHDAFNGSYVGPVGPLVLSGDIEPGDRRRLLERIGADLDRFLSQNALVLASVDGDMGEAMKIAELLRSLDTEVSVAPMTGRCAGPCFFIYAAAARRTTGGAEVLGFGPQRGAGERAWLTRHGVSAALVDELGRGPPDSVHWLTEAEEARLGGSSPAFAQELATRCAWDDSAEREALAGRRPFGTLERQWNCRTRLTQAAASAALKRLLPPSAP